MEIQVRTDRALKGGQDLAAFVGYELVAGLGACAVRVLSALVELSEDTPEHGPSRLRCHLEVRPRDHEPVIVSRLAVSGDAAIRGAVEDMRNVLERMFSRIDGRIGHG